MTHMYIQVADTVHTQWTPQHRTQNDTCTQVADTVRPLGGVLSPINCMLFSRRRNLVPFTPSVQVMVRLFPSTTVTAPTGLMVTVWASETPSKPTHISTRSALKHGLKSCETYTERTKKNERRFHCSFPVRLSLALVL